MPLRLPLVDELPEHTYTIALDGVQYLARLTYRERTASWYLDISDEDGNDILLGRRLSPSFNPDEVVANGPAGTLFVTGADPYARAEIELIYLTADEVAALRAAAAATATTIIEVTTE